MEQNNIIFLILIAVFILISMLFLVSMIFILFKNKELTLKENEIKNEYNNLSLYDFFKKNIPIEHIAFNNPKYESLSNFFNEYRNRYEIELENLKEKIYKLPDALKIYDWKNFNAMYKSIVSDIKDLKESLSIMEGVYNNVMVYRDHMSFIAVSYRDNTKAIIDFYEKHLSNLTNDETITSLCKILKQQVKMLNSYIEVSDIDDITETLSKYNFNFTVLWNLINNLYLRDQEVKYINFSVREIEDILKDKFNSISQENTNFANKTLTKINKNIKTLNKRIQSKDFNQIENVSKYIIGELFKIKDTLNINLKYNKFLSDNKKIIIESLKFFLKEHKSLQEKLLKVYNNFFIFKDLLKHINVLATKLHKIVKNINSLLEREYQKKNNDHNVFLARAKEIIKDIVEWSDIYEWLIKNVSDKYHFFKLVVKEITSNKMLLSQMLGFISKNKIDDYIMLQNIHKLINEYDQMEISFKKNNAILVKTDDEDNHEYKYLSLSERKLEVSEIYSALSNVYYQKIYLEKLMFYANVQIAKHNYNYSFDNIVKLYEMGKYNEGLNLLIKQIRTNRAKLPFVNKFFR